MIPRLVTLDAAGTLVRVQWSPAKLARKCIESLDLPIASESCSDLFSQMLRGRWPAYAQVNLLRSEEEGDKFWRQLCIDWIDEVGLPASTLEPFGRTLWDALYGPQQAFFSLYEDSMQTIEQLRAAGVHMAVISNWDYSLHRILKMLGVHGLFDMVIASLEEGFEKPDPRIFHLALDRFGVAPEEALHVGDDATDDHDGARAVGMRALLVDRSRTAVEPPFIPSLLHILESPAWTS